LKTKVTLEQILAGGSVGPDTIAGVSGFTPGEPLAEAEAAGAPWAVSPRPSRRSLAASRARGAT
jgi:hypothetical protein